MAEDDKHDEGPECPLHGQDVLTPIAPLPNNGAVCIRHTADHQIMIGEMVDSRNGQSMPDSAHIVERGQDGIFRVGPTVAQLKAGGGPAQVATDEYRESWERTFGKQRVGLA